MRGIHRLLAIVLVLVGILTSARAYGQGGATGAISGAVMDTSGGSVAGAEVQIIDTRTESLARKVSTNADGSFVAPLLPPGTYIVVVNKSGFAEAKASGIEVRVTETTKVTIALKPGAVSEKVEISAQITSVETTNAATGQSLGTKTVRELPLATQNYQQLLTLSAGAQSELNASAQLGRGNVRVIVNGQREDNNNYLIEGISATGPTANNSKGCPASPITIDAVIVSLLQFKSNQFEDPGGYLIPSVPGTPGVNVNADTCQVTLNTAPLIVSKPGKYTDDQFTANWDREFHGAGDKIAARFFFSDSESFLPFGAGGLQASLGGTLASSISATDLNFPYDIPVHGRFFSVNETHLFSPTLVNDFRFGFVHINDSLVNVPPVTVADVGINRPTNNITKSIYKFTLGSSGFQIGPTPPADQFQNQNTFNFVDTVSWVRGTHVFRFGGDYTRIILDKLFPQTFNGQLFFVNSPGQPGVAGGLTDFQKALAGQVDFSFGGGGV